MRTNGPYFSWKGFVDHCCHVGGPKAHVSALRYGRWQYIRSHSWPLRVITFKWTTIALCTYVNFVLFVYLMIVFCWCATGWTSLGLQSLPVFCNWRVILILPSWSVVNSLNKFYLYQFIRTRCLLWKNWRALLSYLEYHRSAIRSLPYQYVDNPWRTKQACNPSAPSISRPSSL